MGKFAVVLLTEIFVILPIILGARFHGHNSYKQYYDNRVNGGQFKYSTTASYVTTEKSYYNPNEDNSLDKNANKESFGSSNVWHARIGGDNYAGVTRCDRTKQTYCEDVPNYPQAFVNQMLIKNSSLLHYAYEDVIALVPRIDNEEEPLCLSSERLIRPKAALNQRNEWLYILQADEPDFRQSLRIEACTEEDTKCRIIDGFAEGYVTTCKQKYIYRELSAISEKGEVVRDYFRLPASCCCHVQFKADNEMTRVRSFSEDIYRARIM